MGRYSLTDYEYYKIQRHQNKYWAVVKKHRKRKSDKMTVRGLPEVAKIPNKPRQTWKQIVDEYNEWKKTPDFKKWKKKQFLDQAGTCFYCDVPFETTHSNVEHVVPKSKGGGNRKSNLVLACWKCNKEKNTTLIERSKLENLKERNKTKRNSYAARLAEEYRIAQEIKSHI